MLGIDSIIATGMKIIDKVIPDPSAKAEAQRKLLELEQSGELAELQADKEVAIAQNKVNEAQAASSDKFTSRMRPSAGYMCMFIIFYGGFIQPFIVMVAKLFGSSAQVPTVETGAAITILTTLCGVRTYEKIKGVASSWVER